MKQSSEAEAAYKENTSGLRDIAESSTTWNFKCDNVSSGYFFVGWSKDQAATEESEIVDKKNPSGDITIESEKSLGSSTSSSPLADPQYDESYKQLVFANFTRLQVESEDDTHGTAAILGSPLVVKDGDQVRIKATAAVGYKFVGWKRNESTECVSPKKSLRNHHQQPNSRHLHSLLRGIFRGCCTRYHH
ncbi:MAG: InlB B-repeat-containing protein [Bacteroidaceae bacterium]|nr:InlB B-repeat-containing protein [Bacteroidaceae bacterium]